MFRQTITVLTAITIFGLTAAAQTFDTSGNSRLNGAYFVREVLIAGQAADGTITSAKSATGTVTFNGTGNYSFSGQITVSTGGSAAQTVTGTYSVGSNGLFAMVPNLLDANDITYGTVGGLGPSAIIGSATEGTNVDLMIAIPVSSGITNSSLSGAYIGGLLDFTGANVNNTRQAHFTLNVASAGNFGAITAVGNAANLGTTQVTQNVSGATYSLTANGSGTVNFGAATTAQLLSGTKNLYLSSDGNILVGGSPAGFDMVVAVKANTGTSNNATASGLYFVGGLEDFVDSTGHYIDGFYGSGNATGTGTTLFHNRIQAFSESFAYDYTYDSEYTVQANGTVPAVDIPYDVTYGAAGKAFIATGANGYYALYVGFAAPAFTGTGVFINPAGVVNAATFSPVTNPVAPGEIVTLFGSGLAAGTVSATTLPLPNILGGVQVKVNGTFAPLFYVTASQIAFMIPPAISPDFNVSNATIQVVNNGVNSNPVTLYTSYTSPGIFSATGNGIKAAAATHLDGSLITAGKPAAVGEFMVVYAGGLGATTPIVAAGAASPSPPATVNDTGDSLDIGGITATTTFIGLTPGLAGLYQLNAKAVAGTSNGVNYLNLLTPDAVSSQTTVNISGGSAVAGASRPNARLGRRARPLRTANTRPSPLSRLGGVAAVTRPE